MNVDIAQQKKILHSMLNVQKVFGFDISKENSAPPIGAPKAQPTPADTPVATSYLLETEFLRT